jgi:hypothetical protein
MPTEIAGRLLYVEWDVRFFCEKSGIERSKAERRMNAIENMAILGTRRWRVQNFELARHVRFAASTRPFLLEWIGEADPGEMRTGRLDVYRSAILLDEGVQDGLIRVLI